MSAPALPGSHASAARALPLLVALSGAAALVYESLWLRSFGLIFGGTTSAVAMVLAVFMGGLALGSALAARRPVADPLLAYARLELLTGAAALVTLPLLRVLALGLRRARRPRRRLGRGGARRHRAPGRAGAAAADGPAGSDRAAGRRVPVARGRRGPRGFRPPVPAQHPGGCPRGDARALRAGAGARGPRQRSCSRRRSACSSGAWRCASLARRGRSARGSRSPRSRSLSLRREPAPSDRRLPSRRAPRRSASRCSGRARTRS